MSLISYKIFDEIYQIKKTASGVEAAKDGCRYLLLLSVILSLADVFVAFNTELMKHL